MTEEEEHEKDISTTPEDSNRTGASFSGGDDRHLYQGVGGQTHIAITGSLCVAYFARELNAEQASSVPLSISLKLTEHPVRK